MWGRSQRNVRKSRRADVLRVRAEARGGRFTPGRIVAALLLAGLLTLAGHTAGRGWAMLRDEVILPPRVFGVRVVEVFPEPTWLSRAEVVRWTGVRAGDNLLTLDLDRIKRDLELVPQIEAVALERVLPDTLRILVRERQPLARVPGVLPEAGRLVPTTYFLDAQARVMPPVGADRPDLQAALAALPVVSGLDRTALRVGRRVDAPPVRTALELVRLFPHSPMAGRADLVSLDVAEPDQVRVQTAQGAEVVFPLTRPEEHLHRWRLVHEAGQRAGRAIRWLDLSVTNNCPLLWQPAEPPAVPPAPAVENTIPGGRHV